MSDLKDQIKIEAEIKTDVVDILETGKELAELEDKLITNTNNPELIEFFKRQKDYQTRTSLFWETVQNTMIANNLKSVKGEWGSITVAERANFTVDLDEVPKKFIKKSADTTLIGNTVKLTGKLPKGVTMSKTKYLLKKFK